MEVWGRGLVPSLTTHPNIRISQKQMPAPEHPPETIETSPLNRNEVAVMFGAGMVVLGTLLPAFHPGFGTAQTLVASGNTVAVVLWGMVAATSWKVAMRQSHEAERTGLLCLLFLAAYGVFLWDEEIREPVATFFGTRQASFRSTAWVVSTVGAMLILLFARREAGNRPVPSDVSNTQDHIQPIGATLAVLGCLLSFAIVNPFSAAMAPADFGRNWHAWEQEFHMLGWIVLCASAVAIVACFQNRHRSPQILKHVIQTFALLIGICLILLFSLVAPVMSVTVAVIWGVFSMIIFMASRSRPLVRWQLLIVYSPFIAIIAVLVVSGEVGDTLLSLALTFIVGAGYVMCRNTTYVDFATFTAAFVVGLPAGLMAIRSAPNEFAETCGMSNAETRVILLGVAALLAWAVYLSFRDEGGTSAGLVSNEPDAVVNSSSKEHLR